MREHNQNRRQSNWDRHSHAHGPQLITCPDCKGNKYKEDWVELPGRRGYVVKHICPTCHGEGKVRKGHF